ncbi:MAG TPA: triacylglycerol lipase [Myxococcota bacterium]|nr:triacylglycerol lipase [Myxococcota bacterium]
MKAALFRLLASGALAAGIGLFAGSSAHAASGYTQTKYPIVLAHGLLGFKNLLGVVDYFFDIESGLESGGARVFVTQVTAVDGSEARGEQLLAQVQQILAVTGAKKVNLIGHSQGAQDTRYVAGVRPDLVASVSTVGGVNKGATLADVLQQANSPILTQLVNAIGSLIDILSGRPSLQDAQAAVASLSTAGSAAFNAKFPAGVPTTACGNGAATANGVAFYSWSGTAQLTNALDISDPILALTSTVYTEANDGLVGRCSSHLGTVIKDDYFYNHLDEVNQAFGLVSPFEANPVTVFRTHANRLKNAGF